MHAAAAVWLIIGLVVLAGFASALIVFTRTSAATTAASAPTPYQSARPQREDAFWSAYQASSAIQTKLSRTNAIAQADQMCAQEGANPGWIMSYAQSKHPSAASLQDLAEMLSLAKDLC